MDRDQLRAMSTEEIKESLLANWAQYRELHVKFLIDFVEDFDQPLGEFLSASHWLQENVGLVPCAAREWVDEARTRRSTQNCGASE